MSMPPKTACVTTAALSVQSAETVWVAPSVVTVAEDGTREKVWSSSVASGVQSNVTVTVWFVHVPGE